MAPRRSNKNTNTVFIEHRDKRHRVLSKYRRGPLLGRGGSADCYEVQDVGTQEVFAVKCIDRGPMTPKQIEQLTHEIALHRTLKHPHIVRFVKSFEDPQYTYLILELCRGKTVGELYERQRLSVAQTQSIVWQVLDALEYLHRHRIVHRDVKLSNIFLSTSNLDDIQAKVGDFGLATLLQNTQDRMKSVCGTPNYFAPEMVRANEGSNRDGYTPAVDTWALGVMLYALLVGQLPFDSPEAIKQGSYRMGSDNDEDRLSDHSQALLRRLLHRCPEQRPSLSEIRTDPFFSSMTMPSRCLTISVAAGLPELQDEEETATTISFIGSSVVASPVGTDPPHVSSYISPVPIQRLPAALSPPSSSSQSRLLHTAISSCRSDLHTSPPDDLNVVCPRVVLGQSTVSEPEPLKQLHTPRPPPCAEASLLLPSDSVPASWMDVVSTFHCGMGTPNSHKALFGTQSLSDMCGTQKDEETDDEPTMMCDTSPYVCRCDVAHGATRHYPAGSRRRLPTSTASCAYRHAGVEPT